jgi:energy-coupling factor transporter ATP-binding protein EcfA2
MMTSCTVNPARDLHRHGRLHTRDQHHSEAIVGWTAPLARDPHTCFTSNFVLDELFTLLGRRAGYGFAAERARSSYASTTLRILRPDRNDELGRLHAEVEAARSQHAEETKRLMKQTRQLQEYAKGHADRLLALDLINEDQYSVLIGQVPTPPDDESAGWRTASDLPLGFADIVPTIQRYLYENDRIYPQALLSNFLALMLTGDFVILAGLSGAGKTMLVKSFAQATGNVPHIIPVKPNWTSAEDLTGYYNPLQRSYLTTPFLDALIAAQRDPSRLHLICLDEMNLARVEYYFADFLSALEEREEDPVIDLYSDEEAGHVRTEFKLFLDCLLDIGNRQGIQGLGDFLKHPEIVQALNDRLGIKDGESLLQMHARLRRMVAGVLNVPARLAVPPNARFIGTVNMDATTQFLSPKVLDRAHVIKFSSPLNYLKRVKDELRDNDHPNQGVRMPADDFPRERYPPFDPDKTDRLTETLRDWSQEFFEPIGIDIGMRLLRQALAFRQQWQRLVPEGQAKGVDFYVLNHLVRQKLLPRFFFNARHPSLLSGETIGTFVERFNREVIARLPDRPTFDVKRELRVLIDRANANDGNFNYWA